MTATVSKLDLRKILERHIGEMFYSPMCGNCILTKITESDISVRAGLSTFEFHYDGTYVSGGVCMLYPNAESYIKYDAVTAWSEWNKENNHDDDDDSLVISEEEREGMTQELLHNFDFIKVYKYMDFVGWKWANCGNTVPTVDDMIAHVEDMCRRIETYDSFVSSGGFTLNAHYIDGGMFILTFNIGYAEAVLKDIDEEDTNEIE